MQTLILVLQAVSVDGVSQGHAVGVRVPSTNAVGIPFTLRTRHNAEC